MNCKEFKYSVFYKLLFRIVLFSTILFGLLGCNNNSGSSPSTPNKILNFSLAVSGSSDYVSGTIQGNNISVIMPYNTNLNKENLVAKFSTSENSKVFVNGVPQVSGVTQNNYSREVIFTVENVINNNRTNYTVRVLVAANDEKRIISFSLNTIPGNIKKGSTIATINGNTIIATMPSGTDITKLYASFIIVGEQVSVNGKKQVSGMTENDFTNTVNYTVTAADGSNETYQVIISVAKSDSKEITYFDINGIYNAVTIDQTNGTILVNVPIELKLSKTLVAGFISTGTVTVNGHEQISGVTDQDFSKPVNYLVTAADGTTKNYQVSLKYIQNSLYVGGGNASKILMYKLIDNAMTPYNPSSITNNASGIMFSANGQYTYTLPSLSSNTSQISMYNSGNLTALNPASVPISSSSLSSVAASLNPVNNKIYVAAQVFGANDGSILTYGTNGEQGQLFKESEIATSKFPTYLAVASDGSKLYEIVNQQKILVYSIASNGNLEQTPLSTNLHSLGTKIVVSPKGAYAYVINQTNGPNIDIYQIENNGSLSYKSSNSPSGNNIADIMIDKTGNYLVAIDQEQYSPSTPNNGNIYSYQINANTGSLTSIGTPQVMSILPEIVRFSQNDNFVYILGSTSEGPDYVYAYSLYSGSLYPGLTNSISGQSNNSFMEINNF